MNPSPTFTVCFYSDANFLAVNILENLLSRNCFVKVTTKNPNDWHDKTHQLAPNNRFEIIENNLVVANIVYDYVIFCGGFINKENSYFEYNEFISTQNIKGAKMLVLFPFEIYDRNQVDKIHILPNSAIIFVGDLVGPRINLDSDLLISSCLSDIFFKRKTTTPVGEVFYPLFVADAVSLIIKWLFSFGPYGKEILLLGNQVSGDDFWNSNQRLVGKFEIKHDPKLNPRILPRGVETETVKCNLNFALTETYTWLNANNEIRPQIVKKEKSKKITIRHKLIIPSHIKLLLMFTFLTLISPFIILATSLTISFLGYKSVLVGKNAVAQNSFLLAQTLAVISEKESGVLKHIPGFGLIYKETGFASSVAVQVNGIGSHSIPIIKDVTNLFENILDNQIYDSTIPSRKIELEAELLYNDTVLIKELTESSSSKNVILAKKALSIVDFEKIIRLISGCRILAGNIPELLGQVKNKTYLVLFENNMELRPTGGFIGSFGLVTFSGGRLSDLVVSDVYSADGQLNGHVEPPVAIKNYLGEANWWLRDSNWDPDFPTSAKRAEWFLDKEIGKQVDGVLSIDLFPIKQILKITGPIFLSDYNMEISTDNLYEKTQAEVETNFFPGSRKKASFLTALSRNLLSETSKLATKQKLGIFKSVYDGLNGRHIQIYLHDNVPQGALSALQWDGAVVTPSCGINCYADLVGIVEANVGMNKSNYFIERNISFNVNLGIYQIDRRLTLAFKNSANPALGISGRYKNYIRVIIPTDSTNISVRSFSGEAQEILTPETTEIRGHKEVGVLMEVLGGDSRTIQFTWSSSMVEKPTLTDYGLYIRKQAGTEDDSIKVNIKGNGVQIDPDPRFALTRDGAYEYNTNLTKDIFSLFSW